MVWWQGLLVVIGSVGLGILVGNIIARLLPLIFSQKRQPNLLNNLPVDDVNLEKTPNRDHPQDLPDTKSAAGKEEQTGDFPYDMTYPVKRQNENPRIEDTTQKISEPVTLNGIRQEAKIPEKLVTIGSMTNVGDSVTEDSSQRKIKRITPNITDQIALQPQKQPIHINEVPFRPPAIEQTPRVKTPSLPKKEKKPVQKDFKKQVRQKAAVSPVDVSQQTLELAESARKLKEAREKLLGEIDLINKEETLQAGKEVITKPESEGEVLIKTPEKETLFLSRHRLSLDELETNFRIATTPWDGKPLAFQTVIWDTMKSELSEFPKEQLERLEQAYIDIGMANHIVWLWSEIGLKSKELENSYKLLCTKISGQLDTILPQKTLNR